MFRILGPLDIEGVAAPSGPKPRSLLTLLLLNANRAVPRDRLVDELWTDDAPETAHHAIQVYVSQLRKAIGDRGRITATGPSYRLEIDERQIDASLFEELVTRGDELSRAGKLEAAARTWRDAESLWRGAIEDAPAHASERARLEALRLTVREQIIEAELALGRHTQLVSELEALVREHPLRERLRRQLVLALYRSERQADALQAYQEARRTLVDELGLDASEELRALEAAILRQDPALDVEAAELRERRRLPAPPTPLIGRDDDVAALSRLVTGDARLVTLTGPGGTGKTRLALEVAWQLSQSFRDGSAFVDLVAVHDPTLVEPEIATAVGVEAGDVTLEAKLRGMKVLLVLDNFEHVDEAAPAIGRLLALAPDVRVLATSRRPLRISGEHEYAVPPLTADAAVELFASRARAVRRSFFVTDGVRRVCDALDRLPLAIELAAALVRDRSVDEIVELLPGRLELAARARDLPARHHTLRATIEWSYELLDEAEREAFTRLGVFAGWTIPAAAAVAGVSRDTLSSLVERSLVLANEGRYSMLETIREYALERLEDAAASEVGEAHADYFLELATSGATVARTEAEPPWLERLEEERANLRLAFDWLVEHDVAGAAALSQASFRFWYVRGHFDDGWRAFARLAAHADALGGPTRAAVLRSASAFAFARRDLDSALRFAEESFELSKELGDAEATARALVVRGVIKSERGEHADAVASLEESVRLARETGDPRLLAHTGTNLAYVAVAAGDHARSRAIGEESLPLLREVGDRDSERATLANLAAIALAEHDDDSAAADFGQALILTLELDNPVGVVEAVEGLAAVAARRGESVRAARLLGATQAFAESRGVTVESMVRSIRAAVLDELSSSLGSDVLESELEAGRGLSLDATVAEASAIAKTSSSGTRGD